MTQEKFTIFRYYYYILAIFLFSISAIFDKFIIDTKITNIYTYIFLIWLFMLVNFNFVHILMYGVRDSITCLKQTRYLPFVVALLSVTANLLALKAISMTYISLVTPILMLSTLLIVIFGGRTICKSLIRILMRGGRCYLEGKSMISVL